MLSVVGVEWPTPSRRRENQGLDQALGGAFYLIIQLYFCTLN